MKIRYYQCFEADRRVSMEVYARGLRAAMQQRGADTEAFIPNSPLERFANNRMVMRFLRYVEYPRQLKATKADIHHVVDHGYAHLLPRLIQGLRCITVHDLIPMLTWKGLITQKSDQALVKPGRKPALNMHTLSYVKSFDCIITPSSNTASDIVEHLGINHERITVIPPVLDSEFKLRDKLDKRRFAEQNQLEQDGKWILVCGREFYKNHEVSLRVLRSLVRSTDAKVRLLKTGNHSPEFDDLVNKLNLGHLVRQRFLENRQQMAMAYNFADCLLFPSLYEGFGMPVAEALACGTPVVTSDRGSLAEVGDNLPIRENPLDVESLTSQVHKCLFDDNLAQCFASKGPLVTEQYRADRVSEQMIRVYQGKPLHH